MGEESAAKKRPLGSTVANATTGSNSNSATSSIQLLLHCVDGCVPYLNPSQLEQHFPPSKTTDLWLGLAVRDSCVAPIYGGVVEKMGRKKKSNNTKNNTKQQQPQSKQSAAEHDNNNNDSTPKTINKVRGYTFGAAAPDPWLLPYTRLTVPSFDLRESNGKTSKNTDNAVHVWTPHGKQKITPDLYAVAALKGLQSHHTVSLFDDVSDEEFSKKRKEKAVIRSHQWFNHLVSKQPSFATATSQDRKPEAKNDDNVANDGDDDDSSSSFVVFVFILVLEVALDLILLLVLIFDNKPAASICPTNTTLPCGYKNLVWAKIIGNHTAIASNKNA
mmetsp:Transcript_14977/g.30999  ORF Transcript_14977/g.30999 Transcript_14977/m.30999 type:complete len:331 (-) Transcript_14977:469-1461(-)